ncbi:MAG: hypothetical protein ACRD2O_07710 [Terriglobia bacterium]
MMHKNHVKPMVTAMFVALAGSLIVAGLFGRHIIVPVAAANPGKSLGTKMVYIDAQYRVDPVTITKVTVGDQEIQPGLATGPREDKPGTPFQSGEDWLKTMYISLLNRTNKVIVRAELQLWFPDTGNGSPSQPATAYTMTFGLRPEIDSYASHGQKLLPELGKQPILLAPGQTLVIHVADYVDAIQSRVEEELPFSQITRVTIQRLRVYFVDGMRWTDLDGFGVPDPDHPGQFMRRDGNTFFPGDPRQYWPPPTQQAPPGRHPGD